MQIYLEKVQLENLANHLMPQKIATIMSVTMLLMNAVAERFKRYKGQWSVQIFL